MPKFISRFLKGETGATANEYGLIAAGIAVAVIRVTKNVGTALNAKLSRKRWVEIRF
jgi:pilus assembly protein Flp/PilA